MTKVEMLKELGECVSKLQAILEAPVPDGAVATLAEAKQAKRLTEQVSYLCAAVAMELKDDAVQLAGIIEGLQGSCN